MTSSKHIRFRRYGRSYHLAIDSFADLRAVLALDEAHWVATSAPVDTISCDATFLKLLDADGDGRITCHDLKQAITWLLEVLQDHSGASQARRTLRIEALNSQNTTGEQIRQAALKMLRILGREQDQQISLQQIRQVKAQEESKPVSEAGVVLPQAAKDAEVGQFISDALATVGGIAHPGGEQGLNQAKLDEFLAQGRALLLWHEQGQIPVGQDKTEIMPLGTQTPAAYSLLQGLRAKIDQYFAQSTVLALEERFIERMGWTEGEVQELDLDDPAVIEEVLRKAPLAKATAGGILDFTGQINPYYAGDLEQFQGQVAQSVLRNSVDTLTAKQWEQIKNFFGPHHNWIQAKPNPALESLGLEKLQTYLDERLAKAVQALIAKSSETALALENIRLVEKATLCQAYMLALANNFVSFPHLYDPQSRAMFEMGTLVMDGRRFKLAVNVPNRAEHAKVAKTSNMFVLYVQITPKAGRDKYEVALPVTSGGKGNLCSAKRGVFYDLAGNEADARVVQIIENPISIREALLSPFVRLGRMLTGKIESITAQAEKQFDQKASTAMSQATSPAAKPGLGGSTGGMLLGAGVALAALGSALAYITNKLSNTNGWAILIGVLLALLAVMVPISIVAFLKLRKRDVSAILEGSGWAINARMRLTRKQGKFFTDRPAYPPGAQGIVRLPWRSLLIILVVLVVVIAGACLLWQSFWKSESAPKQTTSAQRAAEQTQTPVQAADTDKDQAPPPEPAN